MGDGIAARQDEKRLDASRRTSPARRVKAIEKVNAITHGAIVRRAYVALCVPGLWKIGLIT